MSASTCGCSAGSATSQVGRSHPLTHSPSAPSPISVAAVSSAPPPWPLPHWLCGRPCLLTAPHAIAATDKAQTSFKPNLRMLEV